MAHYITAVYKLYNLPYTERLYIDGIPPKGPPHHANAWQIGPYLQDTLDIYT